MALYSTFLPKLGTLDMLVINKIKYLSLVFLLFFFSSQIFAVNRTIDLVVSYKTVNFAGETRKAIAVNNQIPAPTLHFKQGDHVTINVHNQLGKGTSVHWHGIILPWQMDGVEGINQKPIPPGGVFHYQFTLHQSGTYWYHAHKDVQEQEGLYGAFIIDPPQSTPFSYNKDEAVVLSDWSNTPARKIFANLKKDGDYYSPRFPLQPSLLKFFHDYRQSSAENRKLLINDYKTMQQMRMSIYDISDVAYDAYLLNGQSPAHPWTSLVKVGDVVRLRFIGAAGSTIYHVKIPDARVQMVHVQGNDVRPYTISDFEIAPGETYDVLVTIEKNRPYIIYAETIDTRGVAIGALLTDPSQRVDYQHVTPFPEPLPVTRQMMANMMAGSAMDMTKTNTTDPMMGHGSQSMSQDSGSMNMSSGMKMSSTMPMMSSSTNNQNGMQSMGSPAKDSMNMNQEMTMASMDMTMPTEATIVGDKISPPYSSPAMTAGTKYQNLTAAVPTNDPDKPVDGIIRMELFGYMGQFIWFINGLPEYRAKPIVIQPGKRYRIIFTNNSMMRHPMHIHGHWFILRNGHGSYDPLLHTIEVPPGATAVADLDTDASGQWFFHCHHLYHMVAGMARVFQYDTIIALAHGRGKPEHEISQQPYINRPIVRVDEQLPLDTSLIHHPMAHPPGLFLASLLDIGADLFQNIQRMTFKGLYGPDYNKLELYTNDAEINRGTVENADIDIFYWHLISQFWAVKGGINYYYRPAETPYWQPGIGIEGLMPYFIDTNLRSYFHDGSVKLDLELSRDTQISNNFFIRTGIRGIAATQTVNSGEIGSGLNQLRYILRPYYRLMPGLTAFFEYEHENDYGAFADFISSNGDSTTQNSYTFGLTYLF